MSSIAPSNSTGLFQKYKKSISAAVATVIIGGLIPGSSWVHDAWGDNRYVRKAESLRSEIRQIDRSIFEIDQEISFSIDAKLIRKYEARRKYYLREKLELQELLAAQTKK